jgi:hypothetical protein
LGRHVESLGFLKVVLGDEPALEPEERFYQWVLADEDTEAAEQAEEQLKMQSLSAYYDAVPMKALALAQIDAGCGASCREKSPRRYFAVMVSTLGDAHDLGWRIRARCALGKGPGMKSIRECHQRFELEVRTLLWTRGRDFPIGRLASRLRCRAAARRGGRLFEPLAGAARQLRNDRR